MIPKARRLMNINLLILRLRGELLNRLTGRIIRRILTRILIKRVLTRPIRLILRRRISINLRRGLFKLRTRAYARDLIMNLRRIRRIGPMMNARSFLFRYNAQFRTQRMGMFITPFRNMTSLNRMSQRHFRIIICLIMRITCNFITTIQASRLSLLRTIRRNHDVIECVCIRFRGSGM